VAVFPGKASGKFGDFAPAVGWRRASAFAGFADKPHENKKHGWLPAQQFHRLADLANSG
jgi:hypothetical protein